MSKTRLNQTAPEGKVEVYLEPKAVCLSLLGLLAASSPLRASLNSFLLTHLNSGVWLQNAKGKNPQEPAPDFTLPWVERFRAQCRSLVGTAGTKIYNTPPSGRCMPG